MCSERGRRHRVILVLLHRHVSCQSKRQPHRVAGQDLQRVNVTVDIEEKVCSVELTLAAVPGHCNRFIRLAPGEKMHRLRLSMPGPARLSRLVVWHTIDHCKRSTHGEVRLAEVDDVAMLLVRCAGPLRSEA